MTLDRIYLIIALLYAVAGMVLGIFMAATHNHTQHVTHAHILLVGFVVSFIYAVIIRQWLTGSVGVMAKVQFGLHQLAALVMVVGLFLLYGNIMPMEAVEPFLSGASITALLAMVLMLVLVLRSGGKQAGL